MQQILLKFPMDIVIRLEESKALNVSWTITLLQESLKCYITIHSNAHRYEAISKSHNFKCNRILNLELHHCDLQLKASRLKDSFLQRHLLPIVIKETQGILVAKVSRQSHVYFVRELILMIFVISF